MADMERITTVFAMQKLANTLRSQGKRISLVPTMGFFHEGHLSLIREAKKLAEIVVVSIFVNPTQFGPEEDFKNYPRDLDRDLILAEREGANIVFNPDAEEMYGNRFQTYVRLTDLPDHLCGRSRPTHFRGVATVVAKLFNIIKPHTAIFGQKDFQQLVIIRQMVKDLNYDIEIIGAPLIREPDGLAMSSRNVHLTPEGRVAARSLSEGLSEAWEAVKKGSTEIRHLIRIVENRIRNHPEAIIDYISVVDPETLEDMAVVDRPALMALAVRIGNIRLIDNRMLIP
jgi:pantoate--beta-alanine ligase